ncbi:MAG: hypothetical protein EZS28_047628, partial [Streblomastix strix]
NEFIGNSKVGFGQQGCETRFTWKNYSEKQCAIDYACKYDLKNQSASKYSCSSTADPRAGKQCPAQYAKGDVTQSCTCDTNLPEYTVAQCQLEKRCKFDLDHQEVSVCPSNVTTACVCDSNKDGFTVKQCKLNKACKFDLANQQPSDCPCLSTADLRHNKTCQPYCIRGYAQSNCTCDTNLPSYPVDSCLKEKNCSFELINQSVANFSCLATGDPRSGCACPAYCIKGYATSDCVCDFYIPDYSIAQCQKEKACKYNLINQTATDCACLSTSDPRAGKACPSYYMKGQPTSECVCVTNST